MLQSKQIIKRQAKHTEPLYMGSNVKIQPIMLPALHPFPCSALEARIGLSDKQKVTSIVPTLLENA
jgi:hypothetical protein